MLSGTGTLRNIDTVSIRQGARDEVPYSYLMRFMTLPGSVKKLLFASSWDTYDILQLNMNTTICRYWVTVCIKKTPLNARLRRAVKYRYS